MRFLALRSTIAALICLSLLGAHTASAAASKEEYLRRGNDHYFNLEYDEAITNYRYASALDPDDPNVQNHIATAILFKELNRLGMLETSAFKGDNAFLGQEKPEPDLKVAERFRQYLFEGRRIAEERLEKDPTDRMALFALAQNYGLHANFEFMIEKSYIAALRNGQRARKFSNKLRKEYPDFVDGYLVAGVQEYVVGSLPWAVKALIALGGISGSKQKGEEWVALVANDGELVRTEARVLLSLLYRRESRPLEAAEVLEKLIVEFPRNYVLRLELGAMYEDAEKFPQALQTFQQTQSLVDRNAPGYGRMPERLRKALKRKIEELHKKISASADRAGFDSHTVPPVPAEGF